MLPLASHQYRRWRQTIGLECLEHLVPTKRFSREGARESDGANIIAKVLGAYPFGDVRKGCDQLILSSCTIRPQRMLVECIGKGRFGS